MEAAMKKYFSLLAVLGCLTMASAAFAQLPTNPWSPKPNDGYFEEVANKPAEEGVPTIPEYSGGQTNGEVLPVDPWAKSRDRSGVKTWRGSAQHGKLNYVGEATTFGDDYGQERLAPEVNRHNMLVLTDYLRKMGYKIPESYDQNIKDMPKNYKRILKQSYEDVYNANDPLSVTFAQIMDGVEQGTGLDLENILFNTMDILATD